MRAAIGTRQQQVADGPGDTAIAVVKRVQGDEPQVTKPGLEQRRFVRRGIQPVEETAGFGLEAISRRCFEMHTLAADGAGHHLHRAAGIVTPTANLDLGQAGVAGGKQRGVPTE